MARELGQAKQSDITGRFPGEPDEHGTAFARFLADSGHLAPVPSGGQEGAPQQELRGDTEMDLTTGDLPHPVEDDFGFEEDPFPPEPDDGLQPVGFETHPGGWDPAPDADEDLLPETDKLPPRPRRGSLPTIRPEPHEIPRSVPPAESGDTGILEPADPAPERLDMDELDPESEEETGITIESELSPEDRITNKIAPRAESAPLALRDTVNFYNQTQSLYGKAPTDIDPNGERDTRPLQRVHEADSEDDKITKPLKVVASEDLPDASPRHDTERVSQDREDAGLEPDEDTQRFFVSEILPEAESVAEVAAPGRAHGELPHPLQADADFVARPQDVPSERITPEFMDLEPEEGEEATDSNRITTRVDSSPLGGRDTDRPGRWAREPAPAAARKSQPKVTNALSRRVQKEAAETQRMIQDAESVAEKLREAASRSRNDLVALSERRAGANGGGNGEGRSRGATTLYDPPEGEERDRRRPTRKPTRKRRERVPTRAIHDIVSELERTTREPVSLSTLLDAAELYEESDRRPAPRGRDRDSDLLLAVSDHVRTTLRRQIEDEDRNGNGHGGNSNGHGARANGNGASSRLSHDLDRLWRTLDARRMPAVVMPPSERAAATGRDDLEPEGWTQEALWGTLIGIAGVTFILGGLFVWVLFKLLS